MGPKGGGAQLAMLAALLALGFYLCFREIRRVSSELAVVVAKLEELEVEDAVPCEEELLAEEAAAQPPAAPPTPAPVPAPPEAPPAAVLLVAKAPARKPRAKAASVVVEEIVDEAAA